MDALGFFLDQHARFHAADVGGGSPASFSERVFGGLDAKTLRARPRPSVNSVAWLVWHMARVEDVVVNHVIVAGAQVLDDGWLRRLAIERRDIGTAMTSEEVTALSGRIDLDALAAYRSAVGWRTREVVRSLAASAWDEEIVEGDTARAAGVISANVAGGGGSSYHNAAQVVGQHVKGAKAGDGLVILASVWSAPPLSCAAPRFSRARGGACASR